MKGSLFQSRPDMTFAVDWALEPNDLSIPLSKPVVGLFVSLLNV